MEQAKNVLALAAEWEKVLGNSRYAAEICLDEDTMVWLARELGQYLDSNMYIPPDDDRRYEIALVVLAVNCAYHYYDDEGFWPHFCRLLGIENTYANRERIGKIIERQLQLLGLKQLERKGPFRYVGAILEQCGISKRYVVPFAGVIKELKGGNPWNAVLTMGQEEFWRRVDMFNCSRYLKDFLKDTAGWRFTIQVCHLLMLYEIGVMPLEDLKGLPGYQLGFWEELIAHFGKRSHCGDRSRFVLKPRLVFVPEEMTLAMYFPERKYADGIRIPDLEGFWQFPLTLLKKPEAWSDYYAGLIAGPGGESVEWITPGWVPDGLPALFDSRYGFISRGRKVKPGNYYLLVPQDYEPDCQIISELGWVRVPGNINYRAYQVLIASGTTVAGYATWSDKSTDISLSWVEPERFRLWCADCWLDVFSGILPDVNVSDFRPIEEQRAIMFYRAGSTVKRIRNRLDLEEALKGTNSRVPVVGQFSVHAFGRTADPKAGFVLDELEFCLLPPVDIRFTQRLYAFNEEAFIEIGNTFPGSLKLNECRSDQESKKWVVPVTTRRVTGTIEYQGLEVSVSIPVYRARMYYQDRKPVRYLLVCDLQKET
ncbi:MAG: hypothetical protein ACPLRU_02950, partial [Desulfofundulus sp.]